MTKRIALLVLLCCICTINIWADYNVKDFGAKGDGTTLDSPAINAAIEEAVRNGGGRVVVPAGHYISGSIRMKNN